MNTKKIKRIIFITAIAVIAVIYVSENPIIFGFCKNVATWGDGTKYCISSNIFPEYIQQVGGFISLSFIFLSLITYRLKDEVFRAWWNFARWWVPIIIVATLFLENAGGGGGIGIESVMQGDFVFVVLLLLYYILIAISLARIIHVYLQLRWKENIFKEKREYLNKVFKWVYGILSLPLVLFIVGIIILSGNNS